jgi:translocation and assembly module TamA
MRRRGLRMLGRRTARLLAPLLMLPLLAQAADRIRIEVDGVDRNIADNVRAYLTLSRYTQREDVTDAQVRRLADRAVDEAADALRPFGYYEAEVRSRTSRDEPNWVVRLKIRPGTPVRMRTVDVEIEGAGAGDSALRGVIASSPLKVGGRLVHPDYDNLKVDLLRVARNNGYLDAMLTRRELVVDADNHQADARITLDTGGRYRFGELRIEQDVIKPELLEGFVRFDAGQTYSQQDLRSTQYALEDSSYFSEVNVAPGDRDPASLTVPVTISGERIRRNRYSVSLGYGTDTGARGRFAWDNRLVNRSGHRWRLETTLSQIRQELVGRYAIPIGDPSLEKLEFSAGYINEELGDLESERYETVASLTHALGEWQRVLFLKLNQETTTFPDRTDSEVLLLIPGISYASLPPNFLTGWVRESAYYFELSGSPQTLGSDASYLRFYTRAERVWPIGGPWHLRTRGELGTSWINEFSELPASQRFFAGGDSSVRGFGYNELDGPDAEGGEHLLVGSLGLERDFPRQLRGTVFVDAGNVLNNWSDPIEYSIGIGVRLRLPMLMIGLDVAQALSEPGKRPRIHLNITQVL